MSSAYSSLSLLKTLTKDLPSISTSFSACCITSSRSPRVQKYALLPSMPLAFSRNTQMRDSRVPAALAGDGQRPSRLPDTGDEASARHLRRSLAKQTYPVSSHQRRRGCACSRGTQGIPTGCRQCNNILAGVSLSFASRCRPTNDTVAGQVYSFNTSTARGVVVWTTPRDTQSPCIFDGVHTRCRLSDDILCW